MPGSPGRWSGAWSAAARGPGRPGVVARPRRRGRRRSGLILADTLCCQQSAATVAKRPGWSSLAAVRSGHILALNDDIASRWGPRVTVLLGTVEAAVARGMKR